MSNKDFESNGYCIVKNAINPLLRDFLTQYALFDEMQNFFQEKDSKFGKEAQVPDAHSVINDPAMETMLLHLQQLIEDTTGLKVFPTYSYYRVYREGHELLPHTDRSACEISVTLCFNHSYDNSKFQWPIFIKDKEVFLDPGDIVIYKGKELEHWREKFEPINKDDWHVQGFFHYVDVNGPYSEWKYDKRPCIGFNPDKSTDVAGIMYTDKEPNF